MQSNSTPVVGMLVLVLDDDEKPARELRPRKKEFTGPILLVNVINHLFLKAFARGLDGGLFLQTGSVGEVEMRDTP